MKLALVFLFVILPALIWAATRATEAPQNPSPGAPILVELFTSEGCSSCPPADALLAKLDRQPAPGADLVVLSEHVDYWNDFGWMDPYSSHFYSERQNTYAGRFGLGSVYTPQMVVDGTAEFVGSNSRSAQDALAKALSAQKIPVRLSEVTWQQAKLLQAHVEADPLADSFDSRGADVYVAVALNRAESQVTGGENGGRRLVHVAVVRNLIKVGELRPGQSFAQDVQLKVGSRPDSRNLRLVAFLQESDQGRVLGAAMQSVSPK